MYLKKSNFFNHLRGHFFCTLLFILNANVSIAAEANENPLSRFSFTPTGYTTIQVGGFWATQGLAQNSNIQTLIGNRYTVDNNNQGNAVVGLGYYLKRVSQQRLQFNYGLNAFYLAPTKVSGVIIQEQLLTNLSYQYDTQHLPIYVDAKAILKTNNERYSLILDGGVGPNFMFINNYRDTPLNSYTDPDHAFTSNSNVAFSATAGLGIRMNHFIKKVPLECGYRFFYLGQGELAKNNNQIINLLKTGNIYANAIICGLTF